MANSEADLQALQITLYQEDELREGLTRYEMYAAPLEELRDTAFIPGDLQTAEYSRVILDNLTITLADSVSARITESRQQRIPKLKTLGNVAVAYYIHESVSRQPFFEDDPTVLANALRHAAAVAETEQDWLTMRVVPQPALNTAPGDLALATDFIVTERQVGELPKYTAYYQDGAEVARPGSDRCREAFQWAEILRDVALSPEASRDFLDAEASRLEAGRP